MSYILDKKVSEEEFALLLNMFWQSEGLDGGPVPTEQGGAIQYDKSLELVLIKQGNSKSLNNFYRKTGEFIPYNSLRERWVKFLKELDY